MLSLIFELAGTALISFVTTFIVFARYHASIVNQIIKEKYEMATSEWRSGWAEALNYVRDLHPEMLEYLRSTQYED